MAQAQQKVQADWHHRDIWYTVGDQVLLFSRNLPLAGTKKYTTQDKKATTQDKKITTQDKKDTTQDKKITTQDKKVTTQDKKVTTQDKKVTTQDKMATTQHKKGILRTKGAKQGHSGQKGLKWYYDENSIFPIEVILKHKQVLYMGTKMLFTFFNISFHSRDIQVFKICKVMISDDVIYSTKF